MGKRVAILVTTRASACTLICLPPVSLSLACYYLAQLVKTGIGSWPRRQDEEDLGPLLLSSAEEPVTRELTVDGETTQASSQSIEEMMELEAEDSDAPSTASHSSRTGLRAEYVSVTGLPWEEDEYLAVGLLHLAAALGEPRSWVALGRRYETGEGVPRSNELAAWYYEVRWMEVLLGIELRCLG